ncbi:MAG: type II toxin-antitoxin system HipA family toxin [Alphaproteobacteria bacterium]|nr:type II toxin-antitoxin system HipA family toxin [Alphaproteobacteria bacterium]MBV9371965.1 type II toxin-antitoxin system HipA family toxin [Alphaproteobacteria bacterium]MBV9901948.1 type II toxin-antitoxin system HipA family toxin [Alphaproteobacteria bacterium]
MTDVRALDILLHDRRVGTITALEGDRSIFTFDEAYAQDPERETLSLSFKGRYGDLYTADNRPYQTRLQPFFSNLLPEGALRDFLAGRTGINAIREFRLLTELGGDLPGAVRALPADPDRAAPLPSDSNPQGLADAPKLRFSLAGVQLKFSALKNRGKNAGLTIPAQGAGGGWIIKLPSLRLPEVPENEFSMMTLAREIGIDVPETELVGIDTIEGLPEGIERYGTTAFAIRRLDRTPEGPVHIEDFAQFYRVYPEAKYDDASYRTLLAALAIETDERSIDQFIRRLTFSVLIGNGDMHLKNWSLIYRDRRTPELSPAYDLLSTVPYLPNDESALKFRNSKAWPSFTYEELATIADKAKVAQGPVLDAARETVERFDAAWGRQSASWPMSAELLARIEEHRASLAI